MIVKLYCGSFRSNYKRLIISGLIGLLFLRLLIFFCHDLWAILDGPKPLLLGESKRSVFYTHNLTDRCPVCLDSGLCGPMVRASQEKHQLYGEVAVREGLLADTQVNIVSTSPEVWRRLEESICHNRSDTRHLCSPQQDAELTYVGISDPFLLANHSDSLLLACPTERKKTKLQREFDRDHDNILTPRERVYLSSGLLALPWYVTLKLFPLPFLPDLMGACGHWVFLAPSGLPLDLFHSAPASVRIQLALNMIVAFQNLEEDSNGWSFFFTRLRSSDIRVHPSSLKTAFLNVQDLMVIDRQAVDAERVAQLRGEELCNEICFQKFTTDVLYGPGQGCPLLPYHSQLMFALLCKEILSPLPEHHSPGFFNYDGHQLPLASPHFPGLLGGLPPGPPGDGIEELLRECVLETLPGGRRNAIALLKQILEDFL